MLELPLILLFVLFILASLFLLGLMQYEFLQKWDFRRREDLRKLIPRLRLHKMLAYMKINFADYINTVPTREMKLHIENCRQCSNVHECDKYLLANKPCRDRWFCPNFPDLVRLNRAVNRNWWLT